MTSRDVLIGMLIGWASFGIRLDKVDDSTRPTTIYITVPEHSEEHDVDGNEMSGSHLAKRIKETLQESTKGEFIVKFKINKGQMWTKEDSRQAIRNGMSCY